MNFLEKDGNKLAVALTTASALAAGFSVYTMATSEDGAELVASAIQILDPTSTNQEVDTHYYIDETKQTLPPVVTAKVAYNEAAEGPSDFEVVNEADAVEPEQTAFEEAAPVTVEENAVVENYVVSQPVEIAPAPVEVAPAPVVEEAAPAPIEEAAQLAPEEVAPLPVMENDEEILPEEEVAVPDAPISEAASDSQAPIAELVNPDATPEAPAEPVVPEEPVTPEAPAEPALPADPAPEAPAENPYQDLNNRIAEEAIKLVGVTDGWQCTEVVQQAMSNAGVEDAQSLWPRLYESTYGHATDNPQAGNLIYYNQGGDGLDHIAIYIGDGQAVHGNYTIDGVAQTVIASAQLQGCDDYTFIQVER